MVSKAPAILRRIKTVQGRFLAINVPCLVLILLLATVIYDAYSHLQEDQRLETKLDTLIEAQSVVVASSLWTLDFERLALIMEAMVADPEVQQAAVFNETGTLIVSAGAAAPRALDNWTRRQKIQFLVNGNTREIGSLEISLSDYLVQADRQQRFFVASGLAIIVVASVIFSAVLANFLSIGIPLRRLLDGIRANEQSKSPVHQHIEWESDDEIGKVIEAFNSLQDTQQDYENNLRAARDDLERRVRERTHDLVVARDEAEAAKRSMSDFLAGISHELRTPLNAILGLSEVMMLEHMGPMGNKVYKEYVADVHNSGRFLLDLINDILDLSKIEVGRMDLNESEVDVKLLVEESIHVTSNWSHASATTIDAQLPDAAIRLFADERFVKQILLNLLSNATKFTTDDGRVTISVAADRETGCRISVADTGTGIPPEDMERIFDPFIQADDPYVRHHEGTGLGLSLVKAFCELHGGSVSLDSSVGQGTTVIVTFPPERLIT